MRFDCGQLIVEDALPLKRLVQIGVPSLRPLLLRCLPRCPQPHHPGNNGKVHPPLLNKCHTWHRACWMLHCLVLANLRVGLMLPVSGSCPWAGSINTHMMSHLTPTGVICGATHGNCLHSRLFSPNTVSTRCEPKEP